MADGEEAYPWLPQAEVLDWLKISDSASDRAGVAEDVRQAAASWVQDQRRDLLDTETEEFAATPRIKQAALLVVGRLYSRKDSPGGVVSFDEFGAASLLRTDPDVRRLLGHPKPVVG